MNTCFNKFFFEKNSFVQRLKSLFTVGEKRYLKTLFCDARKPLGFAWSRNYLVAQGTIEYLVVVGVVIMLSLVVVAMVVGFGNNPSQQILSSSNNLSGVSGGGIVIVEAVSDFDESGFVVLKNYSGNNLSLIEIKVDDNRYEYDNVFMSSAGEKTFDVKNLCVCGVGESKRTCEFEFFYLTQSGLEKKESKSVTVNCVSGVSVGNDSRVVKPKDVVVPEIFLKYPLNGDSVDSLVVEFEINLVEENSDYCFLFVGDDSNTYFGVVNGDNYFSYSFENDSLLDWSVMCVDKFGNKGYSETFLLNVDSNQYQITTCLELQNIDENTRGDYELMNDINCSETKYWNYDSSRGYYAGFSPIGLAVEDGFYGSLDGKGNIISELYINRTNNPYFTALFLQPNGAKIGNFGMVDGNIIGGNHTASIGGQVINSSIIYNVYTNNKIHSVGNYVGGIVGYLSSLSKIINSYNEGAVVGVGDYAGGISGMDHNAIIINSYNSGTVSAKNNVGGISSGAMFGAIIKNSFSTGKVFGTGAIKKGLFGAVVNSQVENTWWYNQEGDDATECGVVGCIIVPFDSNFYDSTLGVYNGNPSWNDGNWVFSENDYPILSWQSE